MPHPAYMTIQGTQQGLITAGALGEQSMGNAWRQGHEDQILVQAINHAIMVPGGAREGHRKHKPLIITKAIDKSSPLIYAALSNGEPLTKCTLDFYRNAAVGGEELFYSVEIKEALIVGVEMIMPHCQELATAHFTQLERVHFAYQVIRWRHKIAGTVAYDEWLGESTF